jgi:hypothetical protein
LHYLRLGGYFLVQIAVGCAEPMGSIASTTQLTPIIATNPTTTQKIRIIRTFVKINNLPPQQIDLRGQTQTGRAIDLDTWLVPIDSTFKLLEIHQKYLPTGELELTSPYLLVRLQPTQWQWHQQLGRVITIGELRKLPELKVEFDKNTKIRSG